MNGAPGVAPGATLTVGLPDEVLDLITAEVSARLEARGTWLTLEALSERTGLPVGALRSMRARGMPAVRPEGTKRLLVNQDEFDEWMRSS